MTDSNNRVKILVIAPYIGLVKLTRIYLQDDPGGMRETCVRCRHIHI